MSTKKIARSARRARYSPAGLHLAFAAINDDGATSRLPILRASQGYVAASRVLARLKAGGDCSVLSEEIARAAPQLFTPLDDDPANDPRREPSMLGETGFVVGFATAWLVLMTMNGGAR